MSCASFGHMRRSAIAVHAAAPLTLSPRSICFTATSSPVRVFRISLQTPKAPLPTSRTCVWCIKITLMSAAHAACNSEPKRRRARRS